LLQAGIFRQPACPVGVRLMPRSAADAPTRKRRRYSSEALFGSKQRAQDAMVAAEILGPCRPQVPCDSG
jgi:hypothetical protein